MKTKICCLIAFSLFLFGCGREQTKKVIMEQNAKLVETSAKLEKAETELKEVKEQLKETESKLQNSEKKLKATQVQLEKLQQEKTPKEKANNETPRQAYDRLLEKTVDMFYRKVNGQMSKDSIRVMLSEQLSSIYTIIETNEKKNSDKKSDEEMIRMLETMFKNHVWAKLR